MTKGEAINWIINLTADIGKVEHQDLWHYEQALDEIRDLIEELPSAQPEKFCIANITLSEEQLREAVEKAKNEAVCVLPSAQPEPLTDNEQRIFLAAMEREMKVCEEMDRNFVREPYEDSLVSVCREIKRKVKGALWTI